MTERSITYSIGDWVVHHAYGIGQIKDVEKKPIRGEQVICFRVITNAGAEWWFPQNETDNPRIRPVASPDVMQRIQTELQQPIGDLDPDSIQSTNRIDVLIPFCGNGFCLSYFPVTFLLKQNVKQRGERDSSTGVSQSLKTLVS